MLQRAALLTAAKSLDRSAAPIQCGDVPSASPFMLCLLQELLELHATTALERFACANCLPLVLRGSSTI